MKTKKTIVRCTVLSRPKCPKSWDALAPTDKADVRRCGACGDDVYWARTDEETIAHAELGHCVARERPESSELPPRPVVIGQARIFADPAPTSEQLRAAAWLWRELRIEQAMLQSSILSGKRCAACSYPMPTVEGHCYVCGQVTR